MWYIPYLVWWYAHIALTTNRVVPADKTLKMAKAKPFIKWVGGKSQLIEQQDVK